MLIGRVFGWLLLLAALAIAGRDLLAWADTGRFGPLGIGELVAEITGRGSVAADGVLTIWAAPVFAVPGLLLVLWRADGARRHRRRRR
jgi:hypothetical protein